MGQYEKDMIDAIAQNNFSIVSADLAKGSQIYKSQSSYISKLNQAGITEKLQSYSINDISKAPNNTYNIDVTENYHIAYDDGSTKNLQQNAVYTMKEAKPLPVLTTIKVNSTKTLSETKPASTNQPTSTNNSNTTTQTTSNFQQYMQKQKVTLTAKQVQFNMQNDLGKNFALYGNAKLTDYYNWGFQNQSQYFAVDVTPTDGDFSQSWTIYFSRTSFKQLYDDLMNNSSVNIFVTAQIPVTVYEDGQGNLALGEQAKWWVQ